MKTIDVTPTWEQWLSTALFIIANATPDKRNEVIENLKPDFVKIAKIADNHNEEVKKAEQEPEVNNGLDKNLCAAIEYNLNPYVSEYSEETLADEKPWIYELAVAYENVAGISMMLSERELNQ